MTKPLSVEQLNTQIKSLLETTFLQVCVEGEISNLTHHKSGHIYFSLKDQQSVISAVMFKGNASYLKFRLEEGLKIVVYGSLTVYTPRGNYQLLCQKIEPSGMGSLALAYEQLKQKLMSEGLFDNKNKKPLPKYPKTIVIVTSPTGAAIEDMKKVAQKRWPLVKLILVPSLVQGIGAKIDIAESIRFADTLNADIMIVGRGGGSIEDLWAFNEEIVARAIFEASTPIISAVGHESDVVISDFVADIRAATPSNAIEIATPDINEIILSIDALSQNFQVYFKNILNKKTQQLQMLQKALMQNSIGAKLEFHNLTLKMLKENLLSNMKNIFIAKYNELALLKQNFQINEPSKKLKKGFAQILCNSQPIEPQNIQIGEVIEIIFPDVSFESKIVSKTKY